MSWFRKKMWLDVEGGWRGWIDTPLSGADAGSEGWGAQGVLLNGGGYSLNSWGTHKRYTFEWSAASSRQTAQFMQSLRQGTYGKGLIRFIEPTIYDTNILPARVAAPHLSVDDGGIPLVPLSAPAIDTVNPPSDSGLPHLAARWGDSLGGYPGDKFSTYVPIPEGFMLAVGAVTVGTGGSVFVRYGGVDTEVPSFSPGSSNSVGLVNQLYLSDHRFARIWIGRRPGQTGSFRVTAITARLIPRSKIFKPGQPGYGYGQQPYGEGPYGGSEHTAAWKNFIRGPWVGGMGNSGVRFNGTPTMVHNTGVDGGQVGYAASFIETGAWGR